ncbi:amidohydrolase family protein [Shewanella sp. MMG014]|uniref:amidohydrolase family protein n=1 Tax=Shewanella sp. MMG014 TaxID=2822691 RepID=UPI001B38E873|nr:amidohydrolase family protein [Shewanella sp. MMG014]MBQ4891778.1 amidohydrolase family protein [Shewanella sp. MMG014]
MNLTLRFLTVLMLSMLASSFSTAQDYDLVITNGRVMDPETQFDAVANVGIKGNKIIIITDKVIKGHEEIDAKGLVVAPGFIDTHFHWTRPIGYKLALRDGVTTAMDLEAGVYGPRVSDWYQMHENNSQVNYGTGSGHEFARTKVMQNLPDEDLLDASWSVVKGRSSGTAWFEKVANLDEGNHILTIIDEGLRQGALGVASTVGYMPGATAREMFEIQRVGANYGRPTAVHLRYTPGTVTTEANGAQEILTNAIALNSPAIINHYNNPGWELVQELLVKLRAQGHNVWGEIYPYAAGQTTINAAFIKPETWVEKLGNKYENTMQDPLTGDFYTMETYQEVLAKAPATQVVLYKMDPKAIPDWCRLPGVTFASDAMMLPGGWDEEPVWETPYEDIPNTHPRLAGTHGTCLRIAREEGIPLMQILAASSYNQAKYLGKTGLEAMKVRGRMQQGMIADITILDPKTVKDNATYAKGTLPTTGIPFVIVNGTIVVKDSKVLKGVNPGQPIRFPIEDKGRFEPLSIENWKNDYLVGDEFLQGGLDHGHVH